MALSRAIVGVAIALGLLAASPAYAKARQGVVTAMEPIQNRGDDVTEGTKKKKSLGRGLGKLLGAGVGYAVGDATAVRVGSSVGEVAGQQAATKIGPAPAPTQYMVTVKFDGGKTVSLAQYRVNLNGVAVGSRVSVEGAGSSARLTPIR